MALTEKILWQIEGRLDQPITVAALANLCAVSPFHMSRTFRAATGLSPMSYLRARRLSVAAQSLAAGQDVLSTAIDAQYGSHEAFTRAFFAYMGVLPSTVRAAGSTDNLQLMEPLTMKKDMLTDVATPEIRTRGAFRVTGLAKHCSVEDLSGIPALWRDFNRREDELNPAVPVTAYGVCYGADDAGRFYYMAAVEPGTGAVPAPDMETVEIPEGRYAVFTHS